MKEFAGEMQKGRGHKIFIVLHTQDAACVRQLFQKLLKAVTEKRGRNQDKSLGAETLAPRGLGGSAFGVLGMGKRLAAAIQDRAFRRVCDS
jgi:hypothetical protein